MGEQHPDYAGTLNNLGLILNASGNYREASPLFVKAADLTLHHLSETYTTLSELEKMTFLYKQEYTFNYLFSILMTYGKQAEILKQVYTHELTLKGMVLEDQLNVLRKIRQGRDSSVRQLFDQWHINKKKISQQLLLPIARRASYLDSLQEASTQQELSRRAVGFKSLERGRSITAADVSQKLQPGQASIEFVRFQLYNKRWTDSIMYAAMILKPGDSTCIFIPLCEEKQLKRLTGAAAIRTSGKLNDSLYKLIWKPLEKHLSGIHAIYYAPAGLLHRIAFQSLRCDPSHLLIDKYQLNQLLSTRLVAFPVKVTPKPAFAAVWGNIDYGASVPEIIASRGLFSTNEATDTTASSFNLYADDTRGLRDKEWPSLPGTKKEMDSLCKIFGNYNISIIADSGSVATEEAFKALDNKSPKILYMATHGFFLPVTKSIMKNIADFNGGKEALTIQQNPMFRSGLVLAGGNHAWKGETAIAGQEDGILTAYEIAEMDLSNTDLVVLSACETALGDIQGNEGVIGLQRAFKMAGVKQLIMSLWKVPDTETMELMTLFYRNWLGGQSTREALRAAQLKMKKKYPPYYWAAFVLVE